MEERLKSDTLKEKRKRLKKRFSKRTAQTGRNHFTQLFHSRELQEIEKKGQYKRWAFSITLWLEHLQGVNRPKAIACIKLTDL